MTTSVRELINKFDTSANTFADLLRGKPKLDQPSLWISHVAEFSILWQILGAVLLLPFEGRRDEWLRFCLTLLAESLLVNQVIKRITNRVRPPKSEKLTTDPRRPSTTSLPSGHASSAFTAATLLTASYPAAALVWFGLAVLVAYTRLHNSVHHASDIIAGCIAGTAIALVALQVAPLT